MRGNHSEVRNIDLWSEAELASQLEISGGVALQTDGG
jgi:hypothetical protein